jgi:hypothetical protein
LRRFSWPVRELTKGIFGHVKKCQNPEILRILALLRIFKIPQVSVQIGHRKFLHFLDQVVHIGKAMGLLPFEKPSLELRHETHTDPASQTACHLSIGSLFWVYTVFPKVLTCSFDGQISLK